MQFREDSRQHLPPGLAQGRKSPREPTSTYLVPIAAALVAPDVLRVSTRRRICIASNAPSVASRASARPACEPPHPCRLLKPAEGHGSSGRAIAMQRRTNLGAVRAEPRRQCRRRSHGQVSRQGTRTAESRRQHFRSADRMTNVWMRTARGFVMALVLAVAIPATAQINPFRSSSKYGPQLSDEDLNRLFASVAQLNAENSIKVGASQGWNNPATGSHGTSVVTRTLRLRRPSLPPPAPRDIRPGTHTPPSIHDFTWCRAADGAWKIKS